MLSRIASRMASARFTQFAEASAQVFDLQVKAS